MLAIDLTGRTALVTGASGGVGRGIARVLAEAGAHVVVHARGDLARAEAVAAEVAGPAGASAVLADLLDDDAVAAMFARVAERSPVDVLVNAVGAYPVRPLADMTGDDWDDVLRANVRTAVTCTRAAIAGMAASGGGAIVNVASLSAHRPALHQSHYNAGKAALVSLTRSAAVELAPLGIRVNSVSPGLVHRDGIDAAWPDGVARWRDRSPLGRLGTPADVGHACAFLASPLASWITGHDLVLDGGTTAAPAY